MSDQDKTPAQAVAGAIDQFDCEFGFRTLEVVGYGTGELACVMRDVNTGVIYDVRVQERRDLDA